MKFARPFGAAAALCVLVTATILFARYPARGFDLKGTPVLAANPREDITDTYFFPSPTNPSNVVAIMDLYPSIPAGAGLSTFFARNVLYTMRFDTKYADGEASGNHPKEDVVLQFAMGEVTGTGSNATQQISVYGPITPGMTGITTKLVSSSPSGTGFINRAFSIDSGQIQVFAGARLDPQFFDKSQFFNIFPASTQASGGSSCLSSSCPGGFASAGSDYFANSNVLSIVVEMPKSLLLNIGGGSGNGVAYWATTSVVVGV